MKNVSTTYTDKEEASRRKPVEIYKIWSGDNYFYYTNGDVSFIFDSETYDPATINRGSASYNNTLDPNTLRIQFSVASAPVIEYVTNNPVGYIYIEVSRLFRDQDPPEKDVIFVGQVRNISVKGMSAEAECVGYEAFLDTPIPTFRYQTSCNHKVFDTGCTLNKDTYKLTTTVTVNAAKTILTSADFSSYANDYFTRGYVVCGSEKRSIVSHVDDDITLGYKMTTVSGGATVDVYPGCDGRAETCRDKYNNIVSFLGFPWIPEENPALRT